MIKGIMRTGLLAVLVAAQLTFAGAARAEQPDSKAQWKTPQVVGSAPVKEEHKATEAQPPRAVSVPYGAKNMNRKSDDK
jgi:hypothetical protein